MSYKIIADSSCELPENLLNDPHFALIPFGLEVGNEHLIDDENLNITELLTKIAACPSCPKSSCPSPQLFVEEMEGDFDRVYMITISSKLSGCYNSAILAKNMYEEDHSDKKIYVIDSLSACGGETQIALLIQKLEEEKLPFEEICERVINYRNQQETIFVLDNLETLRKNGRLSHMKALVASTLNIKPVCAADNGEIVQIGQGLGMRKALTKLVDEIIKKGGDLQSKHIIINHCNNEARAITVKEMLLKKIENLNITILSLRGLSTLYANDGGIVVTF